jgi:Xaa-Pro aminopeptidase
MTSRQELTAKIGHLRGVLEQGGHDAILLSSEGAVRWLTGLRHQVIDVAPDAQSPVQVLIRLRASSAAMIFFTARTEMPRIRDQVPNVFNPVPGTELDFHESLPPLSDGVLLPGSTGYDEVLGAIVRPLVGGATGPQMGKLEWLYAMTTAVLAETALQLKPGMTGAAVKGLVFHSLAARDVECNLILVALAGQEKHLHPLYSSDYRVEQGCWVKLVAGGRYAELIASVTVMAKIGSRLSAEERSIYSALQQGAVEYADLYRRGAVESDIYREIGARFAEVEKKHGLEGFQPSAYHHHLGGPISPLGNRDYLLEEGGTRSMFPWMQFAINPCEVLRNTKAELQGIVMPEGAPLMLDGSRFVPKNLGFFSEFRASGGTVASVSNVVEVPA